VQTCQPEQVVQDIEMEDDTEEYFYEGKALCFRL